MSDTPKAAAMRRWLAEEMGFRWLANAGCWYHEVGTRIAGSLLEHLDNGDVDAQTVRNAVAKAVRERRKKIELPRFGEEEIGP